MIERLTDTDNTPCTCLIESAGEPTLDRRIHLALYQDLTGRREYHPYWDIVAAIGGMDESLDDDLSPSDERFLARAVAQL